MSKIRENKIKVTSRSIAAIFLIPIMMTSAITIIINQPVYAAPLKSQSAIPSNNIVSTTSTYEIMFTTATAGIMQSLEIEFPNEFNIAGTKIIERLGIGPGAVASIGNAVVYIVNSPVNVAANTPIRLELSNIVNKITTSNSSVTITTKDVNGTVIDGPTTSAVPLKQIGTNDLVDDAVTSDKIGRGQVSADDIQVGAILSGHIVDGGVHSTDILDGSITGVDIGRSQIGRDQIGIHSLGEAQMNPSFLSLQNYYDGLNVGGWNPNGVTKAFNIKTGLTVIDGTHAYASLDFGGGAICAVADNNPGNIADAVQISCDRAPANGATLKLMLLRVGPPL